MHQGIKLISIFIKFGISELSLQYLLPSSKNIIRLIVLTICFWICKDIYCQKEYTCELKISSNHIITGDSLKEIGVEIRSKQKEKQSCKFYYKIRSDEGRLLLAESKDLFIKQTTIEKFKINLGNLAPGFYNLEYFILGKGEKQLLSDKIVLGINPSRIKYPMNYKPNDFDTFWSSIIMKLDSHKLDYKEVVEENLSTSSHLVRVVEILSLDSVRIYGFLIEPRSPKNKLPILIHFPGYKGANYPEKKFYLEDFATFLICPRGHGRSKIDYDPGFENHEFLTDGLISKETYSYLGVMTDAKKALDYVIEVGDFDTAKIFVGGGSQGGGIALALSGLSNEVDGVIADYPFLTDFKNAMKTSKWVNGIFQNYSDSNKISIDRTLGILSYFDVLNFIDNCQCPIYLSFGLLDPVATPRCMFNLVKKKKKNLKFQIYPNHGHGLPPEHFEQKLLWLRELAGEPSPPHN